MSASFIEMGSRTIAYQLKRRCIDEAQAMTFREWNTVGSQLGNAWVHAQPGDLPAALAGAYEVKNSKRQHYESQSQKSNPIASRSPLADVFAGT